MNELQLQKTIKPTSVRVPDVTRRWLRQNQRKISDLIRYGPNWYDTMVQQAEELRELRENIRGAQEKLRKMYEENYDLRIFKERTLLRIKSGEVKIKSG